MNKMSLLLSLLAVVCLGYWLGSRESTQLSLGKCTHGCDVKMAMRKLWEDHIVWTRNYIISELADLNDLTDVTNRLLKNQVDIGDAIRPFYGDEAGNKLAELLKEHILIASSVVKAAKAGNSAEVESTSKNWYKNADDIAAFLAGANPFLPEAALKDMLYKHLEYTTGEVTSRLGKKWQQDIEFYDTNHDHMLMLSDALIEAITKQFAAKAAG